MIEAQNLTKKYGNFPALVDLNLHIEPGEIFCMLGSNGAGKTTTVNLFLNFIKPTTGRAFINGIDVNQKPLESKKHLSYIPEQLMLYPNLTGLENLLFFSQVSGNHYRQPELEKFLREAGLQPDAIYRKSSFYSKGMRQKVGIAIAIAKKAKVLLLDEPTSGLDPQASNEFGLLLKKMSQNGAAILMTMHDLFRAKETGDRIGIMKQGHLVKLLDTAAITHNELETAYLESVGMPGKERLETLNF
jgi:ABC-2 type transport system ATP-binding protein